MVESVGSSTIRTGDTRIAGVTRVAPATPAATPATPASTTAAAATTAPTLAKSMAASAPVDSDRVQQIKAAIAAGTFPLSPSTIADQLIALKYDWIANEQA